MDIDTFVKERRDTWQRLEHLVLLKEHRLGDREARLPLGRSSGGTHPRSVQYRRARKKQFLISNTPRL